MFAVQGAWALSTPQRIASISTASLCNVIACPRFAPSCAPTTPADQRGMQGSLMNLRQPQW
jgi:hypothetical protein